MKGPNPFSPWATGRMEITGRKPETNMYKSILKEIANGRKIRLLVTGVPGAGKSTLLMHFAHLAEKEGMFAPFIKAGKEGHKAFMARARAELGNYLEEKAAEGLILERMAKIEGKDFMIEAARKAGGHSEGLIMFIDDAERLKDPGKLDLFLRRAMKDPGNLRIGFVVSSTKELEGFDAKIRLDAFDEHDVHEMIEAALKKGPPKMGEGCLGSITSDSGGNPMVARTMCYVVYERLRENEKIISRKHYLMSLSAIMGVLSRDFFDPLFQQLPASEKKVLKAFAEEGGPAHISDIARKLRMRHATTLALRLVEKGQLVRVDRGIYRVFTKLYGKYVVKRM